MQSFKIDRTMECDVVVAGGGTAGVFAAISAARSGARTVLIEKNSRLGGTVTSAGVNFPGLFFAWGKQIISGPCWEAIERTVELGGASIPEITYKPERHWMEQIRVNRVVYTKVISDMCREAGVLTLTDSMLSYADEKGDGIKLLVTDREGLLALNTKTAIDCTGDARLALMLGYECAKSKAQQPATLHNHMSGYDFSEVDVEELKIKYAESALVGKEQLPKLIHYLRIHKVDNHISCCDADTAAGRRKLEADALDRLMEIYSFYRNIKGLENISFDLVSDETGVRESNRVVGEYIITSEDYLLGTSFADSVCYAFYPVDLHVKVGIEQTFLKDGVVPQIPYRAMIPKNARRLLCAGRCVSSDTYANSALRVQAPCMAMGQAAGVAAALATLGSSEHIDVKNISYDSLRKALSALGAIVPGMTKDTI